MNENAPKNWPPFYPLVYYDIETELPANVQLLAKRSFLIWQGSLFIPFSLAHDVEAASAAYVTNLIAAIVIFFSGVPGYSSVSGTMSAAFALVLMPMCAFFSWHLALYKALKYHR